MHKPLLALAAALLASPAWPNTLISNVNGIQVGADGKIHRFTMLEFDEHTGRVIRTIEPSTDGKPAPVDILNTFAIDGHGRTLLPGLIDAHGHVTELGRDALQLDLIGTTS